MNNYYSLRNNIYEIILDKTRQDNILKSLSLNNLEENKIMYDFDNELQAFLCNRILQSELAQRMDGKAIFIIQKLIAAYLTNLQQLPDLTIRSIVKNIYEYINSFAKDKIPQEFKNLTEIIDKKQRNNIEALNFGTTRLCLKEISKIDNRNVKMIILRKICDFIAGMTDKFALEQYEKLYIPNKY